MSNSNQRQSLDFYQHEPVPSTISFEAAIDLTQQLLSHLAQSNQDDDPTAQNVLSTLIKTQNGARGFFVTYLTHHSSQPDHPSPLVINALRSAPETVADLMVKNLAMSSAMIIFHQRHNNEAELQGAQQVQRRSQALIQQLQMNEISEGITEMLSSLDGAAGQYQSFLKRWKYDAEQLEAIRSVFQRLSI